MSIRELRELIKEVMECCCCKKSLIDATIEEIDKEQSMTLTVSLEDKTGSVQASREIIMGFKQ